MTTPDIELPGTVHVRPPLPRTHIVPMEGPVGPPGPPGEDVVVDWFTGHGPPGLVVGAGIGDMYVDLDTGELYQLH